MDLQRNELDLEDGEITESDDDEIYNPLQRPELTNIEKPPDTQANPLTACHYLKNTLVDDESQDSVSSTSGGTSSSTECIKKLRTDGDKNQKRRKKRIQRIVYQRVTPTDTEQPSRTRFKKYNIWTAALQEDALTENMKGCDVTHRSRYDRNVENYDFSLHYHMNGENRLKRRYSNSTDDELSPSNKRGRKSSRDAADNSQRRSVKSRLGKRVQQLSRSQHGSSSTSGGNGENADSDNSNESRYIEDMQCTTGRELHDVAREMASKLCEEKDTLLVRVFDVLGLDIPMEIYKETQRIEADGGMMIRNGERRRTPGGVFLFLLKHHDSLTAEQQKSIFSADRADVNKSRKEIENKARERKVEELKKRLSEQGKDLPALHTRKDYYLLGPDLHVEHQNANLSNPPPSPVGQGQSSPEYKTINHVTADAPSTSAAACLAAVDTGDFKRATDLISYDDDFLDVNCGEMDLF